MLKTKLRTSRRRDEAGAFAVIFALTSVSLFVLAGYVTDLGLARDVRRQAQNAADASALAAANVLYPSSSVCTDRSIDLAPPCFIDAVLAAESYASKNFDVSVSAWAACVDPSHYWTVSGTTSCVSFTDGALGATKPTLPTKVKVRVPSRTVAMTFGTLAGVQNVAVGAFARATMKPGGARSCGLCVIGTQVSNLGNGDVTVTGGSVQVNADVNTGPNGGITVTGSATIDVAGAASGHFYPTGSLLQAPNVTVIADPLASLSMLSTAEMTAMSIKTDPCSSGSAGGPGVYGNVSLPKNATCTLQPGLYVIVGVWSMGNNSVISGLGVTLYAACGTTASPRPCNSPGEAGGVLDMSNGNIGTDPAGLPIPAVAGLIAPVAVTARFPGFAVIYDRNDTSGLSLQGNGYANITGTIYAKQSQLQFPGNSCFRVTNGPVIVGSLYGNGNTGCLNLTSVIGANIPIPPGQPSLDQ
jgi:Flp pilus assembly protein TadG